MIATLHRWVRIEQALDYARRARDLAGEEISGLRGEAHLVLGQAYRLLHREEEASAELAVATEWLNKAPRGQEAAQNWLSTAETLSLMGDHGKSITAYHRALECAGL